jgi:hypothetical protein
LQIYPNFLKDGYEFAPWQSETSGWNLSKVL